MNGMNLQQADETGAVTQAKEGHFFKDLQDNVEMFESDEMPGHMETDVAAFVDPRSHYMGIRMLCSGESLGVDANSGIKEVNGPHEYDLYRHSLGILESSRELGSQLPLNIHLHNLNGVSFDKGCYIG
mmetsp:Transcript_19187/g.29389  ORF Transcript_19187/g.29389 Transcript_19187/m.29389 type:complete len:128 (+) Transcript_19187:558-941(+)